MFLYFALHLLQHDHVTCSKIRAVTLSENPYGCYVIHEFIRNYADKLDINPLIVHRLRLSCSKYGNYVMQGIIDHPIFIQFKQAFIIEVFCNHILELGLSKYGSFVVCKCVDVSSTKQRNVIKNVLLRNSCKILKKLLKNEYGSYIPLQLWRCCKYAEKKSITDIVVRASFFKNRDQFNAYRSSFDFLNKCKKFPGKQNGKRC